MIQHDEELGCIRYRWVYLEGRPGINVGRSPMPEAEAIQKAETYWKARDAEIAITTSLRQKYDRQVYIGMLPTHDAAWDGPPGEYAYVLKDRKRHGKYQILDAISLA